MAQPFWETVCQSVPQKIKKNTIMYNPAMLLVGITEVRIFKSLLYTHDYSSIVHIGWNVEETQVSISQMWNIPIMECYSPFKNKEIQ